MTDFFQGDRGQALKHLAETLWSHGFVVYLAGGCVRDFLLGRPYHDLDVVTDAPVEQIQSLFAKTIPVGVQFGIVRVLLGDFEFEVARFRRDGPYVDGRHPDFVSFCDPVEDAQRRDFTVNAMFYDLKNQQVLDFVNGQQDLKNRLLRAVGEPTRRFSEDYLRILRLLRFSCQLDFSMEPHTAQAAKTLARHLTQVSGERLCVEITKALRANPHKALLGFQDWNLAAVLFPQWTLAEVPKLYLLKDRQEVGWLLAMWLLFFQTPICEKSILFESESGWQFSKEFLVITEEMNQRFKLSREELRRLKEVASVLAWPTNWFRFRPGFRGVLSQSEAFTDIFVAAQQLKVWDQKMEQEVFQWRQQPAIKPFLSGQDVLCVAPAERGLVLKESLYLQYENVLQTKTQAQEWLRMRHNC